MQKEAINGKVCRVPLCLSVEELAELNELAQSAGMSRSAYVRTCMALGTKWDADALPEEEVE